jgi:hypothetical protein
MKEIDYTELHNQIIKQAFSKFVLTDEQKQRLFRKKAERACELSQARKRGMATRTER